MIRKKNKRVFIEVKMKWQPGQEAVWINNSTGPDNVLRPWELKDAEYNHWPPLHLLLAALISNYLETLRSAADRSGATIVQFKTDAVAQIELNKENAKVIAINFYPEIILQEDGHRLSQTISSIQVGGLLNNTMNVPVIYHTILHNVA